VSQAIPESGPGIIIESDPVLGLRTRVISIDEDNNGFETWLPFDNETGFPNIVASDDGASGFRYYLEGDGAFSFRMGSIYLGVEYPGPWITLSVDPTPPILPSEIVDFSATDDEENQVTVTWSAASNTLSYNLYETGILVESDVASGYVHDAVPSTRDYFVRAIGSNGYTDSNSNSGTSLPTPPPSQITDLNATDDQPDQVTITFSAATNTTSYDLYQDGISVATGISSGHVFSVAPGTRSYYVRAIGPGGNTDSLPEDGTSIDFGTNEFFIEAVQVGFNGYGSGYFGGPVAGLLTPDYIEGYVDYPLSGLATVEASKIVQCSGTPTFQIPGVNTIRMTNENGHSIDMPFDGGNNTYRVIDATMSDYITANLNGTVTIELEVIG